MDDITILPANASNSSVTWSSSDESIAAVSTNGIITGQSVGSAVITVSTIDGNFIDTVNVTVESYVPITGISLSGNPSFEENDTESISVIITPSNATNKSYTAAIDDSSIMEVSLKEAGYINLTGLTSGSAVLTITCDDDPDFCETFNVTVLDDTVTPEMEDILVMDEDSIYVSFSEEIKLVDAETIANYSLILDPSGVAISISVDTVELIALSPKTILYLHLNSSLSIGDEIELTVNAMRDLSDNLISTSGDDHKSASTYVPGHGLNVSSGLVSDSSGTISLSIGAVSVSSASANFNPDSFQVYAVTSGDALSQSSIVAAANIASDGSTGTFQDLTIGGDVIFANGIYDLYVKGDYDVDGNFATTEDQYFSFEGPISYTVTSGL